MEALERIGAALGRAVTRLADLLTGLMFAAVFVVFVYKVAQRYLAGDAVAWADEVSVVLFIWIIFIANGFVVAERRQISFDLLHRNLGKSWQRRVEILRGLLLGGILLAGLPGAVDYTLFLWRERTPVLLWRLDYVYACFALFVAAMVVRLFWRSLMLAAGRGR